MRSGISGRRIRWALGLAAAGSILAAGVAFGAAPIIGQANDTYSASTYTIDQGEVAQLQVTGSSHNVTAHQNGPDGKALFFTPTISGGSAGVNGTQYLTAGSYTFFCSVHPSTMQATLQVTGNGTPQARPKISLAFISRKLAKVVKKGKLQINVGALTQSDDILVEAKLGKTSLGKANVLHLAAGAKQTVSLKLNKAAKNKLKGRTKATITAVGTVAFGAPVSAKGKLK